MPEFKECASCAAKPGAPTLCASCLHNRRLIENLFAVLEDQGLCLRDRGERFNPPPCPACGDNVEKDIFFFKSPWAAGTDFQEIDNFVGFRITCKRCDFVWLVEAPLPRGLSGAKT